MVKDELMFALHYFPKYILIITMKLIEIKFKKRKQKVIICAGGENDDNRRVPFCALLASIADLQLSRRRR